jgi:hypothetical protein
LGFGFVNFFPGWNPTALHLFSPDLLAALDQQFIVTNTVRGRIDPFVPTLQAELILVLLTDVLKAHLFALFNGQSSLSRQSIVILLALLYQVFLFTLS